MSGTGDEMIDPRTVERAKKGDVEAFGELYGMTSAAVYTFMLKMTGNRETAEDLTQEVYLKAWRSLRSLKSPKAFVTWLHRIAINVYRDWSKSAAHRMELASAHPEEDPDGPEIDVESLPSRSPSPHREAEMSEVRRAVEEAIASLPESYREVVVMHHIEGLGVREIAESLGIPQGTVMSRLARARKALRDKLAKFVEGD